MSVFWRVLMALTVIIAPLSLAWALLGWSERRKGCAAGRRERGKG